MYNLFTSISQREYCFFFFNKYCNWIFIQLLELFSNLCVDEQHTHTHRMHLKFATIISFQKFHICSVCCRCDEQWSTITTLGLNNKNESNRVKNSFSFIIAMKIQCGSGFYASFILYNHFLKVFTCRVET